MEACKVCDNNCGYCKFDCNCSTDVEELQKKSSNENEREKPYDYRSVIYAIEHILLVYEKDISPNLHNKLSRWKKNIQEELDKEKKDA